MHYVFKVERSKPIRVVYYTGEADHVWSEHIENAEPLTKFQADIIAKIAHAHAGHTHRSYTRRKHWSENED